MIFEVIISALIIMLVSLSGIIFVNKLAHDFLEKRLSYLVSFSAGVFLVTAGSLALEVFHIVSSASVGVVVISLGYALAWLMHKVLPETHHHHDPDCPRTHQGAKRLIVGDSIHNIADGVILVTAFLVSTTLGIAVTISIIIHEALQEISEFFVLRQAGYSVRSALLINLASSSTILVGVALGYFALTSSDVEALLLGVSAGFFLHVVIHDLLPKRTHQESGMKFVSQIILVVIGASLMALVSGLVEEPLEHGSAQDNDYLE